MRAKHPTEEQKRRSQTLAREFRKFRITHLYTQAALADQLKCSRRTIASIENVELISPRYSLLVRFRNLKRKEERAERVA